MKRSRYTAMPEPIDGYFTVVSPLKGILISPPHLGRRGGSCGFLRTSAEYSQRTRSKWNGRPIFWIKKSMDTDGKFNYILPDRAATITPKKLTFDYPTCSSYDVPNLDMSDIDSIPVGDEPYTLSGCVTKIAKIEKSDFLGGMCKQDVITADEDLHILLRLWGDMCDTVEVGKSYCVKPIKIRLASGPSIKYVITPNSEVHIVLDIMFNTTATFTFPHIEQIMTGRIVSKISICTSYAQHAAKPFPMQD